MGSRGKKTFKRYFKSKQTDKQTHTWMNQLIESIGPDRQTEGQGDYMTESAASVKINQTKLSFGHIKIQP